MGSHSKRTRRKSRVAQLHADWIGMLQPEGLVVSVAVLEELELYARQELSVQQALREQTPDDRLPDLDTLLHGILGWKDTRVRPGGDDDRVDLPDVGVSLCPDRVAVDPRGRVVALVRWIDGGLDATPDGDRWPASHTERFERLLRRSGHPVGLLAGPDAIRLIYAPAGEAPGRLTFPVAALRSSDGRLLVDALHMLLGARRVFGAPKGRKLRDVLRASRERQEQVTEELAAQVEEALRVLLAGFDEADRRSKGKLLSDVDGPTLYDGLTTVLLRLIFVLYAEDRGLLPMTDPVYADHYSVSTLGDQLTDDFVAHGEAQTRRFSAWPRLVSLFRMIWGGASHGDLTLPPRQGDLFHPDRFPFLEGRRAASSHTTDPVHMPPVDDAVIRACLERLLVLEGQRISYRNLEVEQIGSVYEALMGFSVQRAHSRAVALDGGVYVEPAALAAAKNPVLALSDVTGDRSARLRRKLPDLASFKATGDAEADAATVLAALEPLRDPRRPDVPGGRHYLQPGAARRASGSHYTPRSLTEPIVRHTLAPLLGDQPTVQRILELKVCDPAMGSGAFLAEVCRQLGDALVVAWAREGTAPPTDRDLTLVARRKVAERCLYGVDKNPRAVQLARLSLWLITSAADLPFTFVDHALRHGDALIGLDLKQLSAFRLRPGRQVAVKEPWFVSAMQSAARTRAQITAKQREMTFARDEYRQLKSWVKLADEECWDERRVGDLLIAAAWAGGTKRQVAARIARMGDLAWSWYPNPDQDPMPEEAEALLGDLPMRPFHWWLEFPEVFGRKQPGFDAVVGNPPFGGQQTIREANGGAAYIKLLQRFWPHAHGNSDLCAYFFLRLPTLLRPGGTFGLVASNTIKQGNTRATGLQHLLTEADITLFRANTDMKWPLKGAAVVVDVVQGLRGAWKGPWYLDGEAVTGINSELKAGEELPDPVKLGANANRCFMASKVYGAGFLLTAEQACALTGEAPARAQVVRPYLGGKELNSNVPPAADQPVPHDRYVIDFRDWELEQAAEWPALLRIVRELVKPERDKLSTSAGRDWWLFERRRMESYNAMAHLEYCFAASQVSKHLLLGRQPTDRVFAHTLNVFALDDWPSFAVLQSRVHEHWARAMGSSMKTDLRYTASSCFETFPFPRPIPAQQAALEQTGEKLYTLRQSLMVELNEGMTQVWNRLHDPHEDHPGIHDLRAARDAMDRAVLAAYGWEDVDPDDGEEIIRRLRKLNAARAAEEAAEG